jgi:hypothetical protein
VSSAAIIDRNNPSTSITFVTPTKLVEDGKDVGKFTIHTNYEEILKFNSNS